MQLILLLHLDPTESVNVSHNSRTKLLETLHLETPLTKNSMCNCWLWNYFVGFGLVLLKEENSNKLVFDIFLSLKCSPLL